MPSTEPAASVGAFAVSVAEPVEALAGAAWAAGSSALFSLAAFLVSLHPVTESVSKSAVAQSVPKILFMGRTPF